MHAKDCRLATTRLFRSAQDARSLRLPIIRPSSICQRVGCGRFGKVRWEVVAGLAIVPVILTAAACYVVSHRAASTDAGSESAEISRFDRHGGAVRCLAISKDGQSVASIGEDRIVRIWDLSTARQTHEWSAGSARATSIAFRPDGKRLVTGSDDHVVRIWNVDDGKAVRQLEGHTGAITCVDWHWTGMLALSCGQDGSLRIWNVDSGELRHRLRPPYGGITCAAFLADGERIISGGEDGVIRLWSVRDGRQIGELGPQRRPITCVAAAHFGDQVLTADASGEVRQWDFKEKSLQRTFDAPREGAVGWVSLVLSVGGTRALGAGQDGSARVWSCSDGSVLTTFAGRQRRLSSAQLTPNGMLAVTGAGDGTARVWQLPLPTDTELSQAKAVLERRLRQADDIREYGNLMQRGQTALESRQFDEGIRRFREAAAGVVRDSLEHAVATEAAQRAEKLRNYANQLDAGRTALRAGNLDAAKTRFAAAQAILPDRDDARKALTKLNNLRSMQSLIESARLDATFTFVRGREDPNPAAEKGAHACLLTSKTPPIGLVSSRLTWRLVVATERPLPNQEARCRLSLVQVSSGQSIGHSDTVLRSGEKVQELTGAAEAPIDGWAHGEYELRLELVVDDGTVSLGEPKRFELVVAKWNRHRFTITPESVQKSQYGWESHVRLDKGDGYRLDVAGSVTPASLAVYRDLLDDNGVSKPLASGPEGIAFSPSNTRMAKYLLVASHLPFGALLCKHPEGKWMPYRKGASVGVADADGPLMLSINSVAGKRQSRVGAFTPVAVTDPTFWSREGGSFVVTILHIQFEAVDSLNPMIKLYLLEKLK